MEVLSRDHVVCGMTAVAGGTIITIPAGRTWIGNVVVSATAIVASGGAAVHANARVSVVGAGAQPPAGDYLRCDVSAPASIAAAIGTGAANSVTGEMIVSAPDSNSVSLVLNATGTSQQSASANGGLMIHKDRRA